MSCGRLQDRVCVVTGAARGIGRGIAMLLAAEDATKNEMIDLTQSFRTQGLTAQQAHDRAWEMVRTHHILLPPESLRMATKASGNHET